MSLTTYAKALQQREFAWAQSFMTYKGWFGIIHISLLFPNVLLEAMNETANSALFGGELLALECCMFILLI